MFWMPLLGFICLGLVRGGAAPERRFDVKQCFQTDAIMLLSAQYAVLCTVFALLRRFAAESDGFLPPLIVYVTCLLPYFWRYLTDRGSPERLTAFFRRLAIVASILLLVECFLFNGKSFAPTQESSFYPLESAELTGEAEMQEDGILIRSNTQILLQDPPDSTRGLLLAMSQEPHPDNLPFYMAVGMCDDNFTTDVIIVQELYAEAYNGECCASIKPYGNLRLLRLDFRDISRPFTLHSIRFVNRLPFTFLSLRFWLLFFLIELVIAIVTFRLYTVRMNWHSPVHLVLVALMIAVSVGGAVKCQRPGEEPWVYKGGATTRDPFSMTYDAFRKGQVYLDVEADPQMDTIEHVYVRRERDESGAVFLWDYAYYEGHYYCYFGVAPVLTYYFPYEWIHHKVPTLWMAVNWFSTIASFLFCMTLLTAVRICQRKPNLLLLLLALPMGTAMCGMYWTICGGGFYVLASAAGFCYLLLSLWTGLLACRLRPVPVRAALLFCSGGALALCVASRPSIALGGMVLMPFFLGILLRRTEKLWAKLAQAAAFLIPLSAGAAGIMWYNQVRFGSPFDFGAAYQITVSNINANRLYFSDFWAALYDYFCLLPRPRPIFPFFEPQWGSLNGLQHYVYGESVVGWFTYPVVALAVLTLPKRHGMSRSPHFRIRHWERSAFLILCFVMSALIAWMDFCMGGVNQRYLFDFSCIMVIGCVLVLLRVNNHPERSEWLYAITCGAMAYSYGLAWMFLIESRDTGLIRHCPNLYHTVRELIMFWQ